MSSITSNRKVWAGAAAALVVATAGVAWLEREPLVRWHHVRGLSRATDADRELWLGRVAGLGESAVGDLFDVLAAPDPLACGNARAALARLTAEWGPDDPRTVALALRGVREFGRLSPCGRRHLLELAGSWFPATGSAPANAALVPACARLVAEAAAVPEPDGQAAALELCSRLNLHSQGTEALSASRELLRGCLRSPSPAVRLRSVQLALLPEMDLLEPVAGLLHDPAVEVRRAAVLAVGPDEAVLEDLILPCLHDADAEVRRLAEAALRSRGRTEAHIKLGFLLTDRDALVRLRVLDQLREASVPDPALWLRRLSHDPSPAVRAAAVRAMSHLPDAPALRQRVGEMAQSDPAPSVSALAQFYLDGRRE